MMSKMEREEFERRFSAMTSEQVGIFIKMVPDDMLWDELRSRYDDAKGKCECVINALRGMQNVY